MMGMPPGHPGYMPPHVYAHHPMAAYPGAFPNHYYPGMPVHEPQSGEDAEDSDPKDSPEQIERKRTYPDRKRTQPTG